MHIPVPQAFVPMLQASVVLVNWSPHVMVQSCERVQSTESWHEPLAEHVATQFPVPQISRLPHEFCPLHEIVQSVDARQSTPLAQEPSPEQVTSQTMPAGQMTFAAHDEGSAQVTTQVLPEHVSHTAGHVEVPSASASPDGASEDVVTSATLPSTTALPPEAASGVVAVPPEPPLVAVAPEPPLVVASVCAPEPPVAFIVPPLEPPAVPPVLL